MSEQDLPQEPVMAVADTEPLNDQLATEAAQKLDLIHQLTSPEVVATLESNKILQLSEVVRELGAAAYSLSRASVLMQDFAAPEALEATNPVKPTEADDTDDEAEITTEHELDNFEAIPELNMTANETVIAQQAIEILLNSVRRRTITNLAFKIFQNDALPDTDRQRFIQILDAYTVTGVLQRHRDDFGYLREGHEFLTPTTFTPEHSLVTDYITDNMTDGGVELADIATFVHDNSTLSPGEFQNVLTSLAEDGFIVYAGTRYYRTDRSVRLGDQPNLPAMVTESPRYIALKILAGSDGQNNDAAKPGEAAPDHHQLSELYIAYLKHALEGDFRTEELHKLPAFNDLSKEEWNNFKAEHIEVREYFTKLFAEFGVKAEWHESGKARGLRFKLILDKPVPEEVQTLLRGEIVPTKTAKAPEDQPSDDADSKKKPSTQNRPTFYDLQRAVATPRAAKQETAEEKSRREALIEAQKAIRFTQVVVRGLTENIRSRKAEKTTLKANKTELATAFGFTEDVARQVIGNVFEAGHIYFSNVEGVRHLSETPPEKKNPRNKGEADDKDLKAWSDYDAYNTARVYDVLAKHRTHVQEVMEVADAEKLLGITKEESPQFRRSLRTIRREGLIVLESRRLTSRSSGGRSNPRTSLVILFPSQAAKERWKTERLEVMTELEARVQTPAQV